MATQHTPGPWLADDFLCAGDHSLRVAMPNVRTMPGATIAMAEHNWNDTEYGERRISWKEAEANARLIAASPELLDLAYQYLSDLRRPPVGDSLQRRIERAEAVIAKATAA